MLISRCVVLALLLVTSGRNAFTAEAKADLDKSNATDDCPCRASTVRFDVSSVEKIILEPEKILEDIDRFWREDGAYQLVVKWHTRIEQPPDLDAWRKRIEAIRDLPASDRKIHPQLINARNLTRIEWEFVAKAVPYLCTFLPPEADVSTTIYFATEIMAAGFQESGDIVIHILNHELQNMFVHELFHRGFMHIRSTSGNAGVITDPVRRMYFAIHNEGMATYVGYKGRHAFPQIGEVGRSLVAGDYDMLDRKDELRRLHTELNTLLTEAQEMDPERLRQRSWQIGVNQRAYYVVGAYMARIIDEALGRHALVETVKSGPESFLKTYNDLVDTEWKVVEITAGAP